ncbi:MAG TPA: DUF2520 domain-containing protein [Candidatus Limnocylindrales bacterium]|nr:DUF2520 domain-containing protein [Candidatus Limnocylindrales bacterium]
MHEVEGAPGHSHEHGHGDEAGRPRLGFVGAGRVGTTLATAFSRAGWTVSAVASRDDARRARFQGLVPGARGFSEPQALTDDAELIFLTVPDDAVAQIAGGLLLYSGQALVHTSGALPASVLAPAQAAGTSLGSFHPLVAFTDVEQALADLHGATIALDGDESLLPLLAELAEAVGGRPVLLPAAGKPAYHAAAMLAAGGLIGLLDTIVEVARAAGLDERAALAVYLPLARQALANAERLGVDGALTGPFLRGDAGTIAGHLGVLRASAPAALPLYVAVARRELAVAERRGELSADRAAEIRRLLDAAG